MKNNYNINEQDFAVFRLQYFNEYNYTIYEFNKFIEDYPEYKDEDFSNYKYRICEVCSEVVIFDDNKEILTITKIKKLLMHITQLYIYDQNK